MLVNLGWELSKVREEAVAYICHHERLPAVLKRRAGRYM